MDASRVALFIHKSCMFKYFLNIRLRYLKISRMIIQHVEIIVKDGLFLTELWSLNEFHTSVTNVPPWGHYSQGHVMMFTNAREAVTKVHCFLMS